MVGIVESSLASAVRFAGPHVDGLKPGAGQDFYNAIQTALQDLNVPGHEALGASRLVSHTPVAVTASALSANEIGPAPSFGGAGGKGNSGAHRA